MIKLTEKQKKWVYEKAGYDYDNATQEVLTEALMYIESKVNNEK